MTNINLFKYNNFLEFLPINENLDKAKKFLKDRWLLSTAVKDLNLLNPEIGKDRKELAAQIEHGERLSLKMGDFTPEEQNEIRNKIRTLKPTEEQLRNVERSKDFLAIRNLKVEYDGTKYQLDRDHMGWLYMFTYFYFYEGVTMEELVDIYSKLIKYKGLLDKLPKKVDLNFIDPNIPNNSEVLIDGLDSLEDYRKIKKVYDQLTPVLKKDYNDSPEVIKQQFAAVCRGFDQMGSGDEEKKQRLWKSFFGEVRTIEEDQVIHGRSYKKGEKRYFGPLIRYTNIREFIKAGQNYLKASENETIVAFYDKINLCNDRYGGSQGADTVFDENGILIAEIKSFQANQMLNGHTRHCIKDYSSQWENYVSGHNNKQYYIYNFNIPQYDNLSTIGITIAPNQQIRACHAKDDSGISGSIKNLLLKWQKEYGISVDLFSLLKSMTKEEIERRERAKIAEREIVKKGLSIEQINKYVKEDGANINKDNCVALLNAVEENNHEKAKVILELGGNPNLRVKADAIINKAQDIEMIKLLVANGSELTGEVFNNICNDINAVEYCLKQGLDPNFDNCLPVRRCCRGSWIDKDHIGEGYFDVLKLLVKYGARLSGEGRNMTIKWAAEYGRIDFMDYMIEQGIKTGFKAAKGWLFHSRKVPDDKRKQVEAYLDDKIKKYES